MPGLENDVLVAKNVNFDFTAAPPHAGIITANGDLLIGSTANPNIQILKGRLTSTDGSVTINYVAPNLDLSVAAAPPPTVVPPSFPHIQGMSFSKSGNTTTFHSWDGSMLTPANPAELWIHSPTTNSRLVKVLLTNNYQVVDAGGAGDMNGNSFGTSSGAWANDMPWYVYAVVNSAGTHGTIAFSRVPQAIVAPAAGKCATRTSSVATTQGSFYFLDEIIAGVPTAPTVASYAAQPCLCIGSFRVQKAASNNWVIQTLSTSDGMNQFQENKLFDYPVGQNGASATSHFIEAGNFPAFTTKEYTYTINRNGLVTTNMFYTTLTVAGASADTMLATFPCAYGRGATGFAFYAPATASGLNNQSLYWGLLTDAMNHFFIKFGTNNVPFANNDAVGTGADATLAEYRLEIISLT